MAPETLSNDLQTVSQIFALTCAAGGVIIFISGSIGIFRFKQVLPLALDFWMAAGLIRLSGSPSWSAISTAAIFVLIRKMTTSALKQRAETSS